MPNKFAKIIGIPIRNAIFPAIKKATNAPMLEAKLKILEVAEACNNDNFVNDKQSNDENTTCTRAKKNRHKKPTIIQVKKYGDNGFFYLTTLVFFLQQKHL